MLERIYVVTDLGPGDGGKGGVVHAMVHQTKPKVIIKRGGAQGSHGVRTSRGESFNFSQWGCGTFEGIPTFLSRQMVISPVGLQNEADALGRHGFFDPFKLLTCDPDCICATPFHRIASQLEELLRGNNPRGTVGTGVGQAYRLAHTLGDETTLRAHELTSPQALRIKLGRQLDYYRERYAQVSSEQCLPDDTALLLDNLDCLYGDGLLDYCLDLFHRVGKRLRLRSLQEVLQTNGTAIVECSHGILTDAETGFRPHVSAIRTLPRFTTEMLRAADYQGPVVHIAVHRAYEVRHGAGPMPTYDPKFTARMLPHSHKENNRWQGAVRAGALDCNLLRRALAADTETQFAGLCLTWFDQILAAGRRWQLCTSYTNEQHAGESYADFLYRAQPHLVEYSIKKPIATPELFQMIGGVCQENIGLPLAMLSVGPTERDKLGLVP